MIEIFFGRADGAVPIDIPGDLLSDIGVGSRLGALGQHACLSQRGDPHLPVLTTHDRHGVVDLFLGRRLEMKILNRFFVGVHTLLGRGLTNRFQCRRKHFAGFGMRAPRRGQTVDHQIHLPEICLDEVDHPRLHLIREGITVQALSVQARLLC